MTVRQRLFPLRLSLLSLLLGAQFVFGLAACSSTTRAPEPTAPMAMAPPESTLHIFAQASPGYAAANVPVDCCNDGGVCPAGALCLRPKTPSALWLGSVTPSASNYTLARGGGACDPIWVADQASRDGGAGRRDVYPNGSCDPCVEACFETSGQVARTGWRTSDVDAHDGLQKPTRRFAWCVQQCRVAVASALVSAEVPSPESLSYASGGSPAEGHAICAKQGVHVDDWGTTTDCLVHDRCSRGRTMVEARIDCERLSDGGAP
jgi:hypothetical protein